MTIDVKNKLDKENKPDEKKSVNIKSIMDKIIDHDKLKQIRSGLDDGNHITKNVRVHTNYDKRIKLLQASIAGGMRLSNDDIINLALSEFFLNRKKVIDELIASEDI